MTSMEPRHFFESKPGEEHPVFLVSHWQSVVSKDDTRLGYEDWCQDTWAAEGDDMPATFVEDSFEVVEDDPVEQSQEVVEYDDDYDDDDDEEDFDDDDDDDDDEDDEDWPLDDDEDDEGDW